QFQRLLHAVTLPGEGGLYFGMLQAVHQTALARLAAPARADEPHAMILEMNDAAEVPARAQRPGHRRALDAQNTFDLVQQFQRVAALAIQLVDEGDDGGVAQP